MENRASVRWMVGVVLGIAVTVGAAGCGGPKVSGADGESGCVPGRRVSCECADGTSGVQTCRAAGEFGACQCGDAGPSGSDDSDTTGGYHGGDSGRDVGDAGDGGPNRERVELPIEVMGRDGTVESLELEASSGSDAERLYLRIYSPSYPYWEDYDVRKASIRLNGGTWIDLKDATVECLEPEASWGCMGGPYPTVRFTVDLETLGPAVDGTNELEFRFNWASASESPDNWGDQSSGYYVLGAELRDGGGGDLVDGTQFVWDDPGEWEPPAGHDNAEAIAEGRKLWRSRDTLMGSWDRNHKLRAACSDCHARDGRDLKYFAFSNEAIVTRSRFHGLSKEEGKKIAAYIRSRTLEDVDTGHTYEPPARPWTPVYQPGPTSRASRGETAPRDRGKAIHEMPSNGSQYWAAGAGLDWALEKDKQIKKHLFPGGVSRDDHSIDGDLKMWHIPVALQFADWNAWLPTHHPLDVWGDDFKTTIKYGQHERHVHDLYYGKDVPGDGRHEFVECWKNSGGDVDKCIGKATRYVKSMSRHTTFWLRERGTYNLSPEGPYADTTHLDAEPEYRALQMSKWATVKTWEVVHTYDLSDEMRHRSSEASLLQWPNDGGRLPFDNAPHIRGAYAGDKSKMYDLWLDNAWYEVNTRINHGRGVSVGIRPNDWRYQFMHLSGAPGSHPLRHATSAIKLYQNCEATQEDWTGSPQSWYLRGGHCDIGKTHWLYGDGTPSHFDNVEKGLAGKYYELILGMVVEGMMYRHSPNLGSAVDKHWERRTGERGFEPASVEPTHSVSWHHNKTPSGYLKALEAMHDRGVKPKLLDRAAQWLDAMIPDEGSDSWDRYRCKSSGESEATLDCSKPGRLSGN